MDWIVVDGVKPWDGRYEFDLGSSPLTTREWGWIKRLTGYLPLTLEDGFAGGDPELFTILAVVAMYRAGKIDKREVPETYERFLDEATEAKIRIESDTPVPEEDDQGPLPPSSNGSDASSGGASAKNSETSQPSPSLSGTPGSAYMEFDRPTSAR